MTIEEKEPPGAIRGRSNLFNPVTSFFSTGFWAGTAGGERQVGALSGDPLREFSLCAKDPLRLGRPVKEKGATGGSRWTYLKTGRNGRLAIFKSQGGAVADKRVVP